MFQLLRIRVVMQVERIVEVIKEVPVERIVHEERIVEVPVEKYVEVPVEKIVYQDKPVEKIVYQDRVVEVPVDKIVEVPVDRFVDRIVEVVKEVPVDREVEKVVYRDREVFSVGFGMAIGHRSEDDEHMVVQEVLSLDTLLSFTPATWIPSLIHPAPFSPLLLFTL